MTMTKKNNGKLGIIIFIVILGFALIRSIKPMIEEKFNKLLNGDESYFYIISSNANSFFEEELRDFAKKEKIDLKIDYYDDLEIIDRLNDESNVYDAVWISNSIWLYMLNNSYLVTNSKSIAVTPVVMGVKKSKAQELGFVNSEIYNNDILNAIKSGKLKYVMNSVTKTNTGATAYLAFLNSLAGSPEVLKSEMLKNPTLINNMKEFFKGVERVSGDENYLDEMFIKGDYEAVINYESTLLELNNKLIENGKEPLYLLYPVDGVAINDMPFGYVNRNQNEEESFNKIQKFLRSNDTSEKLEKKGLRTWFGGVKEQANTIFKKEWGIDTTKYLMPFKYPSKTVMNEAFELYIEALRKPTHTVFVLDTSGSMNTNNGLVELKEAMNFILDKEQAKKDNIQFSNKDKITIITFNRAVNLISDTKTGADSDYLINFVNSITATGDTNIYDPSITALDLLHKESDEYMRMEILMTDGRSNNGSYLSLENYYKKEHLDIPVYSITFGNSSDYQLQEIADLTNAKVFDGKSGLVEAFKEVRSYS